MSNNNSVVINVHLICKQQQSEFDKQCTGQLDLTVVRCVSNPDYYRLVPFFFKPWLNYLSCTTQIGKCWICELAHFLYPCSEGEEGTIYCFTLLCLLISCLSFCNKKFCHIFLSNYMYLSQMLEFNFNTLFVQPCRSVGYIFVPIGRQIPVKRRICLFLA